MSGEAINDNDDPVIPWLMRRDLELHPADDVRGGWTIKDPVRLNYYRIESEELEFLKLLNGRRSLAAIANHLKECIPELRFAPHNMAMFLGTAVRAGLLIPSTVGYGQHLSAEAAQEQSSAVWKKLLSLISHRFRGIDPTWMLRALDHRCGWIFKPQVLAAATLFVLGVGLMVLSRWQQLQTEIPTIAELLTVQNAVVLGICIAAIKVLHEIGHGLACQHYGGECHELGFILVGFLPLLYCDVSDSWKQNNRIYRMQVAAAGIAVELLLAAVCGVLWMASVPGPLHSAFLNIMLICSLNTVLINGNPLLRYDGYYVLSDALRLPNLGPQSRQAVLSLSDRIILGIPTRGMMFSSRLQHIGMPLFGFASQLYRLIVLATILLVIHSVLKPWRLEPIAVILAASAVAGLLSGWLRLFRQRLTVVSSSGARTGRAFIGLVVFTGMAGALLFWPFSHSIEAPFTWTPGVSTPVYVSTAGKLQSSARYQQELSSGDQIAELGNANLELSIAQLEGDLRIQKVRLDHLASARRTSRSAAMAIPAAKQSVQNLQDRLQTLKRKAARLTLHSSVRGTLMPPRRLAEPQATQLDARTWQDRPLDPRNTATWLEEQTLLGWVGTEDCLRAIGYVVQQDIEFIRKSAETTVTFASQPGVRLRGRVANISIQSETKAPPELSVSGALAVDSSGQLADTRFLIHVQLDGDQQPLPPLYSTGVVSVHCQPLSLASRLWRMLSHTFAFEL